ncbi:DUF397 domain-containing protein [Kitasatospora sp. HPMI-4]|uniref:DUF397 domain-containing protein n=1 Tax=Kitasatospora sp. HPMI-4 TaxID=3448443 RepID=UPI003F1B3CA8
MTADLDLSRAAWIKSSHSSDAGQCIEVAPGYAGIMPVRDSKDPEGPTLVFPADTWQGFLAGIKAGEFPII